MIMTLILLCNEQSSRKLQLEVNLKRMHYNR